jgi:hypothetical protein|tara:strand:- start:1284 stop:1685 length:402 start_codon:yes stop_codon:yes gene_type:complete
MKISKFDRQSVKAIRVAMDIALAKVESEYGIKISTGNASFSGDEVTFKVKANAIGAGGQVKTKEASAWEMYANLNGLGAISVGDTIELQGKSFTVAGWNSRARKSPISITDANGRGYKCSVEMVKMYNRNLVA